VLNVLRASVRQHRPNAVEDEHVPGLGEEHVVAPEPEPEGDTMPG
jgi:hypothetical protein